MKKIWLLACLFPVFAFVVNDWISVRIDNRVSVSFPLKPTEKEMSGNLVWTADASSDARCSVMRLDFTKFGYDSAKLMAEMEQEGAIGQFRVGLMGQFPNGKLLSEKGTTTKGKLTFDYVLDMGKENGNELTVMYTKNIFIGSNMYSLSFYEKRNRPQDELRKKFFNSFSLN